MKEQSHKEEMSAALRGDFQRLRERGVPAALVPQDTASNDAVSEDAVAEAEDATVEDAPVDEPETRRTWVARLTGR